MLIFNEIVTDKLPRTAKDVLLKCDKYIDFMNCRGEQPFIIKLYRKDYRKLSYHLERHNQNIDEVLYKGFRLMELIK